MVCGSSPAWHDSIARNLVLNNPGVSRGPGRAATAREGVGAGALGLREQCVGSYVDDVDGRTVAISKVQATRRSLRHGADVEGCGGAVRGKPRCCSPLPCPPMTWSEAQEHMH